MTARRSILSRRLDGASRRGMGYAVWMVVAFPVLVLVMSWAVDALSMAAAYRRAVGLGTVAAQTGAARTVFSGGATALSADSCAWALWTIQHNTPPEALASGEVTSACALRTDGLLEVRIQMRAKTAFTYARPRIVVAVVRARPGHGIDSED